MGMGLAAFATGMGAGYLNQLDRNRRNEIEDQDIAFKNEQRDRQKTEWADQDRIKSGMREADDAFRKTIESFSGPQLSRVAEPQTDVIGNEKPQMSLTPNLPGLPWTYSTEAIASAGSGKTDRFGRELSVPQALSSAVGVKLGSYPVDVMRANASGKLSAERSEIIKGMKSDGRSLMRKGLDQEEYDQRKEKAISKLTERTAEFEEKNRKSLGLAITSP